MGPFLCSTRAVVLSGAFILGASAAALGEEPSLPYDLASVRGMEAFPQDDGLRESLARNGFAIVLRFYREMHEPYIESRSGLVLPAYVSADSAFRVFHLLLEKSLERFEQAREPLLRGFLDRLDERIVDLPYRDADWGLARETLRAWVWVGRALLAGGDPGGQPLSPLASLLATEEIRKIREGRTAPSSIFAPRLSWPPVQFRYPGLEPVGIYESDDCLRRVYRAVRWFGMGHFSLGSREHLRAVVLLALSLRGPDGLLAELDALEAPFDELLGPTDDPGVADAVSVVEELRVAERPRREELESVLPELERRLAGRRRPAASDRVVPVLEYLKGPEAAQGVRLFGPRHTWEGELLTALGQRLAMWREWPGPEPLHSAIGLGSEHAAELLAATASRANGVAGGKGVDAAAELLAVREVAARAWRAAPATVYTETLQSIRRILLAPPEGAPSFTRTDAWRTKCVVTGLAALTAVRHTWALQRKEAEVIVFGYDEHPPGYVAPYPEFFGGFARAAKRTSSVLRRAGGTNEALGEVTAALDRAAEVFETLAEISRRQLEGRPLDTEHRHLLSDYGYWLRGACEEFLEPRVDELPIASRFAGVSVDGGAPRSIYTALGRPMEIYVIRTESGGPGPPQLQLNRGGVYSYYEIDRPDGRPLTDAKWRDELRTGQAPAFPRWTGDLLQPIRTAGTERLRRGEWQFPTSSSDLEVADAAFEGFLRAQERGHDRSADGILELWLRWLPAAEAWRLVELAPRVRESFHLAEMAQTFAENATPAMRKRLLETAREGGPARLALAIAAAYDVPASELRSVLGDSELGRLGRLLHLEARVRRASDPDGGIEGGGADPSPGAGEDAAREFQTLATEDPSPVVRAQGMLASEHLPATRRLAVLHSGAKDASPLVRALAATGLADYLRSSSGDASKRAPGESDRDRALLEAAVERALWYVADPALRERGEAEVEMFHRWIPHDPFRAPLRFTSLAEHVVDWVIWDEELRPLVRRYVRAQALEDGDAAGRWGVYFEPSESTIRGGAGGDARDPEAGR